MQTSVPPYDANETLVLCTIGRINAKYKVMVRVKCAQVIGLALTILSRNRW